MSRKKAEWQDKTWAEDLVFLFAVAEHLESNDQGGLARLLRVAAEFLNRRAAFEMDLSANPEELDKMLGQVEEIFARRRLGSRWENTLVEAIEDYRQGQRVEVDDSPLPLVCRRCGGRYLPKI